MSRVSLILSDLYLPEEATRESAPAEILALPSLEWLLRFAGKNRRIDDWRSWLAGELGAVRLTTLPPAQIAARGLLSPEIASTAWLATPVRLEARLDHVRLTDRGLIRMTSDERTRWCAEFARTFGPEYVLHEAGPRGFLLTGAKPARVATTDPARLIDTDVGNAVPRGHEATELRRLGAEIEMWMHAAPLNTARARLGEPAVSSLWLWGGGQLPPAPTAAVGVRTASVGLFGADPCLAGVARELGGARLVDSPANFKALPGEVTRQVIELAPMSGEARESLSALEANWFAPMREALSDGSLAMADILANDRWFRIAARPGWRVWRRRRGWLDSLRA